MTSDTEGILTFEADEECMDPWAESISGLETSFTDPKVVTGSAARQSWIFTFGLDTLEWLRMAWPSMSPPGLPSRAACSFEIPPVMFYDDCGAWRPQRFNKRLWNDVVMRR